MSIDSHNHVPIFLQIARHLGASIASGFYRPGEALPSQRTLAVTIKVNPNTVQKAFDELERRGLVNSRRGLGVFVTPEGQAIARGHTEKVVGETFGRGIAEARGAGFDSPRIRELFEASMSQAPELIKEPQ